MPDIGARLTLKGEAEYKRALQEIAQGQKVMRSEMELVSARFEGQEKSVEALTARHDVLERTLNGERDRVEKLREAVQKSAETYGEGDKRTQNWQIQLNRAEASAEKLEHQIDRTDKELEELNGSMADADGAVKTVSDDGRGLGDVLNGLGQKFGISLPEDMRKSINGLMNFDGQTLAVVGTMGAAVTAIVETEKKLMDLTRTAGAAADELMTTADKTGISAEKLQEYSYAAELVDVSVDTITGAQTKLLQSMDKARDGADAQAEAFENLGVSYQNADGSLRDTDEVFWDVLDALGEIDNATDRDAAAMDILGKSARDLNPLIKAGRDRMDELAQEAHDVGYVMSTDELKGLQAVDDASQRYEKSVEALKNQIAVEFAPSAEKAITRITDLVKVGGKALKESGIVTAFGGLLETVTNIIAPMDDMEDASYSLAQALKPVAVLVATIADALQVIKGIGTTVWGIATYNGATIRSGWNDISTGMGWSTTRQSNYGRLQEQYAAQESQRSNPELWYGGQMYGNSEAALYAQWEAIEGDKGSYEYWKKMNGYNAAGSDNWRGGVTWVGENGPERVFLPEGTQIRTAQESRMETGMTWYGDIVIDAHSVREIQDVVRIMQELPMRVRKRG